MNPKLAPHSNNPLLGRWEPVYRSQLHYLVTWSTRGRKPVLKERHLQALQRLIPELCEERNIGLVHAVAGQDHVHVLFGLRPSQSVATAVREIKSRVGLSLLSQYPELRVWLGGNLVWDDRYAVETVSPARLQRVQERLRERHRPHDQLAEAS